MPFKNDLLDQREKYPLILLDQASGLHSGRLTTPISQVRHVEGGGLPEVCALLQLGVWLVTLCMTPTRPLTGD